MEYIPKYFPQSHNTPGWARSRPHLIIQIVLFHYIRNCTSNLGGPVKSDLYLLSFSHLGPAPGSSTCIVRVQQTLGQSTWYPLFDKPIEPDYTKARRDAAVKVSAQVVRSLKSNVDVYLS